MKKIISLLTLLFLLSPAFSQSNPNEAKAAYLLAEDSYSKSDLKSALLYLEQASESLGEANAKILYLTIIIQQELAKTDKSYLQKLDSSITAFLQAPDVKSFNEEKNIEVLKIKLQVKNELAVNEQAESNRMNREAALKTFENPEWPLGTPLSALRSRHPDAFKKSKGTVIYPGFVKFSFQKMNLFMKNDRLSAYNENLFYHVESDGTFAKGKADFALVLERFRQDFKYLPKPIIELTDPQDTEPYKESYSWESDLKSVELVMFKVRQTNNYISSCSIIVNDKTAR